MRKWGNISSSSFKAVKLNCNFLSAVLRKGVFMAWYFHKTEMQQQFIVKSGWYHLTMNRGPDRYGVLWVIFHLQLSNSVIRPRSLLLELQLLLSLCCVIMNIFQIHNLPSMILCGQIGFSGQKMLVYYYS